MADARRMGKMELFAHFGDKFDLKRTQVRDFFEELLNLSENGSPLLVGQAWANPS